MKHWIENIEQAFRRSFYFFPLQLFFVHLKKNILLLSLWVIIFGITLKFIGTKYGISTLFLAPEYLGRVDFRSFLIFGFAVGGFVMAFNLFSYVMNGFRFPFLATLSRPFYKYCINNALIPAVFVITYIITSGRFQYFNELISLQVVIINLLGFVLGYILFQLIGFSYFVRTNRSIYKDERNGDRQKIDPVELKLHKKAKWNYSKFTHRQWLVVTYLQSPFRIKLTRDISHYAPETIRRVFRQNRLNASLFQILAITSFICIGLLRENPYFVVPAGASIILLFTIIVMILSALHSWLRGWSTFVILIAIVALNYFSKFDYLKYESKAYGINYNNAKNVVYSPRHIHQMAFDTLQHKKDLAANISILNKWKKKQTDKKPKIVFIATSGGGLRSGLWTFYVLRNADSLLNGKLLHATYLVTGSSGGMIGAEFIRELYREKINHKIKNYYNDSLVAAMGKDLLNPVVFSIAVNDLFIRTQHFDYKGHTYLKDRGYAFEHQLNINTYGLLNKQLKDLRGDVAKARIPMMIFTPTIINDGRKLFISSQPISFLSDDSPTNSIQDNVVAQGVDFEQLFGQKALDNLSLTSVIRMNASFPYILPSVSLPSTPQINVMDAGVRDNYGVSTMVHYIYALRKWLEKNTSGIIILNIRDTRKRERINVKPLRSISQTIMSPLGSFYDNLFTIQDFTNDQFVQYMSGWYKGKINVLDFQLDYSKENPISLSLHLTSIEKKEVLASLKDKNNHESLEKLINLLGK